MNKCDFCTFSKNDKGILYCPYNDCKLTQKEINEILKCLNFYFNTKLK